MAKELYSQANDCFVDERYSDALKLYDQVLKLEPNNVNALVKRSFTHYKLQNFTG